MHITFSPSCARIISLYHTHTHANILTHMRALHVHLVSNLFGVFCMRVPRCTQEQLDVKSAKTAVQEESLSQLRDYITYRKLQHTMVCLSVLFVIYMGRFSFVLCVWVYVCMVCTCVCAHLVCPWSYYFCPCLFASLLLNFFCLQDRNLLLVETLTAELNQPEGSEVSFALPAPAAATDSKKGDAKPSTRRKQTRPDDVVHIYELLQQVCIFLKAMMQLTMQLMLLLVLLLLLLSLSLSLSLVLRIVMLMDQAYQLGSPP
jgi:hypothetical protein